MQVDYKKYVGQYVKRFPARFSEQNIWKIGSYREVIYFENDTPLPPIPEFNYYKAQEEFWADVDDSIIITNELPIIEDERIANVNSPEYKGYNPFENNIKK